MKRILVTRFSAMGDVAMVASVLKALQEQHTDTEIILVSRRQFKAFFDHIPRLIYHVIDPKTQHRGLYGLIALFAELKKYKPEYIADLHNNLRSNILDTLFRWNGFRVRILDKGRKEKKALTRPTDKVLRPLRPMTERYADVFRGMGFPLELDHILHKEARLYPNNYRAYSPLAKKNRSSPFAQHPYKVWDLQKMGQVLEYLSAHHYTIFVFGGGASENEIAEQWAMQYQDVHNTIGRYSLTEELDIIAQLDIMISMDSAGMHMASLVGTGCVSIWGATHPYAGFMGYGQSYEDCIQVAHPSRPSSVYGNKPCDCDGIEAIDLVTVEMVTNKIDSICV